MQYLRQMLTNLQNSVTAGKTGKIFDITLTPRREQSMLPHWSTFGKLKVHICPKKRHITENLKIIQEPQLYKRTNICSHAITK